MCMPSSATRIFIVCPTLLIKRSVGKFKQHSNVPYPYHYKKGVPYFLAKIEAYCIVLKYRTAILGSRLQLQSSSHNLRCKGVSVPRQSSFCVLLALDFVILCAGRWISTVQHANIGYCEVVGLGVDYFN